MLLITSGAYVESELFSEFGKIPPAFLPVGNKRLYTYQIAQFARLHAQVYLTIPGDFALDEADAAYLRAQHVDIISTEPGATLGAAVQDFLTICDPTEPLVILYGDTLITDPLPEGDDWLALGYSDEYYNWHHAAPAHGQPGGTWSGMFSFSNPGLLRDKLRAHGDFIAAVSAYDRHIGGLHHWKVARWLDFGHVHTYFDSKCVMTTQRSFNQLCVCDGVVTKSSEDTDKILAEAAWFEAAPPNVKPYLAGYICRKQLAPAGYQLEYLHLAALNELYVFGRLPARVWRKILRACDAYLHAALGIEMPLALPVDGARQTYLDKTMQRLAQFSCKTGTDLDAAWRLNGEATPSLRAMATDAADAVLAKPPVASFVHGDLCFSNILFDFRAGRIKVIDPRGTDAMGRPTPYGDLRYDVGKLAHSVLGLYDYIVAGFYELRSDGQELALRVLAERCHEAQQLFLSTQIGGRLPAQWDCYPVMVLLFLSMLPLHADNPQRQQALMANGIRLYQEWKNI
ncbi:MAG: phosphotransferase [Pseudomonadota bacterium]